MKKAWLVAALAAIGMMATSVFASSSSLGNSAVPQDIVLVIDTGQKAGQAIEGDVLSTAVTMAVADRSFTFVLSTPIMPTQGQSTTTTSEAITTMRTVVPKVEIMNMRAGTTGPPTMSKTAVHNQIQRQWADSGVCQKILPTQGTLVTGIRAAEFVFAQQAVSSPPLQE